MLFPARPATSSNVPLPTAALTHRSVVGLTATNYLDSGLAGGTLYYYVVSALLGGSQTSNSVQVAAATLSPTLGSLIHRYSFLETNGPTTADSIGGPV